MALIKCPECGSSVSDRAATCIHCGCPLAKSADGNRIRIKTPAPGSYDGLILGQFKLMDMDTMSVIATVGQGGTFDITSDKPINAGFVWGIGTCPPKKCRFTVHPGKKYKISWTVSWAMPAVVCNEVDYLDSD